MTSAVGTTDPISNNHDAALLHIARNYRPDKIVLVYSQEMFIKQDLINKALLSIEGYNPIIEIDSTILNNDEVFLFDKMYEVMGLIVQKYTNDDDEIILNLSSGTPQIISALFALNRINDYNTQAIQVATPKKGANREYKPLTDSEIDALIVENQDNSLDFVDRSIKDKSEKFTQALVKRHLRSLIASFDYQAAEAIINRKEYNKLLIKENTSKKSNYKIELTNNLIIDNLEFNIIDNTENDSNYICRIDKSTIALPLYFRNRIDGDYIILKGSNNKKKIKEIMIENKLPISQRITYPILIDSNNNIIWIPGIKKSKFCSKKNEKYDIIIECKEREENYE